MSRYCVRGMASLARQPASRRDLVLRAVDLIAERLPAGWSAELQEDAAVGRMRADGLLRIAGPDGQTAIIVIEAKRRLETRDVSPAVEQLGAFRAELTDDEPFAGLVVATYLSPAARARLGELVVRYG